MDLTLDSWRGLNLRAAFGYVTTPVQDQLEDRSEEGKYHRLEIWNIRCVPSDDCALDLLDANALTTAPLSEQPLVVGHNIGAGVDMVTPSAQIPALNEIRGGKCQH